MLFSKYAEEKFDILNKYKVFYTREDIKEVINNPDKTGKKNKFISAEKNNIKVLYKIEAGKKKIVTFYPTRSGRDKSLKSSHPELDSGSTTLSN